jgi:hypothetical protein
MMKWRCDAVRPDELVDVEGLAIAQGCLILDSILNDKHLRAVRVSREEQDRYICESNLTYIRDLEHLLIIERLLGFHNARKINEFGGVGRVGDMENGSSGV